MAKSVLNEIITRLKISKYYSVSVDSTPDEGHIDQLTVIFRYMENLIPVERFLTFLPNSGHTGKAIAETLIHFLNEYNIDIKDCRGQSYDNAANMSGKYNGMQAFIKRVNGYAIFVPCCGHSLNLVGKTAANSCPTAIKFFDFVQNIYVFFTSSPSRYQILTKKLSLKNSNTQFHVPKNLNDTRWSCRADATKALVLGYNEFKETLEYISKDPEQKEVVKNEANGLLKKITSFEIAFYLLFWNDILDRFNATNHLLQNPKMVLQSAVTALTSLKLFVQDKRNSFDDYEETAKKMSGKTDYPEIRIRSQNVRLTPLENRNQETTQLSQREKFRSENFLPVIDQLYTSLTDRIKAYDIICKRFGFFRKLGNIEPSELLLSATNLVNIYSEDLEATLGNELLQFNSLVNLRQKDCGKEESWELFLFRILYEDNLKVTFPNVEIALRMYLVLMVANSSGERSFSKMKLIKNRLRTTMTQDRLTNLTILSIESDILRSLDFEHTIKQFSINKSRKVCLL
ncbi:zinc finger MYM-type protein 1-like [Aphis gossypii]|uniref:zinc finger MYM-type protein 1-like n=1 Tax=Aphis gossypii TaxID=80765 RepID=UPI0021591012|nr:zinc finger MYM-type protein 1-like [Aphis gossypii]